MSNIVHKSTFIAWISVCAAICAVGIFFKIPSMSQGGIVLLGAGLLYTPILFLKQSTQADINRSIKRRSVQIAVFAFFFFFTGELALRIWFYQGASFGAHYGPIVKRFESNFKFNRYDGPSRGPEIEDPSRPYGTKILIQGDSITWGEGVRSEQDLYTTRLLTKLRKDDPETEMAVMAKPGRELDGHLLELAKWGDVIKPDIIIYQFYPNDLKINKKKGPRSHHIWRRVFFHRTLVQRSYFWFFIDFSLDNLLVNDRKDVQDDEALFSSDKGEWQCGISVFRAWAREAKRLTPNVLVVLYPSLNAQGQRSKEIIYKRFAKEAQSLGIEVLDLWDVFGELKGELKRIRASTYDLHPSAEVHQKIAQGIYDELSTLSSGLNKYGG